jgi:MoxR-like ATPase
MESHRRTANDVSAANRNLAGVAEPVSHLNGHRPGAMDATSFHEASQRILTTVNTVIDGKSDAAKLALTVLLAQGHLLLEDVPGVGKTLLAKTLARTIDCTVNRIQFTPDLLPSDVTGVSIYNQSSRLFEFRPGAVFANIVIGDEINRASAKTQSALLECMEEHQVTVDGHSYRLDEPFMVVATQNPIEMEGTYPLPEAQRDRFMARISMGYPDKESEIEMLETHQSASPLAKVTPVVTTADVAAMIAMVQQVYVSQAVKEYTVSVGRATRESPLLRLVPAPGPCCSCCALRRPLRPWMAATLSCRTTLWALPKLSWRTGSSWTAKRRAQGKARTASCAASCPACLSRRSSPMPAPGPPPVPAGTPPWQA